jgi:dolichol-phosphate mannosyltransferase
VARDHAGEIFTHILEGAPSPMTAVKDPAVPASKSRSAATPGPELSVIVPTRNEHGNVRPVYDGLCRTLQGIDWEAIFVDDDSQDGTPEAVCRLASQDRRVRCIQRIGRRGLASACVEGILASSAPYVAVMDADLQHDERLLPRMLDILKSESIVDAVVGSRYVEQGSIGTWNRRRAWPLASGTRLCRFPLPTQ